MTVFRATTFLAAGPQVNAVVRRLDQRGTSMGQTVSDRVRRMRVAEEATRRPFVDDLGLVRAALEEAAVPITDALLDFHREFAGYTVECGLDEGVLGIIHREVCVQSWVEPMKVGGYLPDYKGNWYIACADMHMSYEMFLLPDGTFDSNGRVASSYFMYMEQLAFAWEFAQRAPVRAIHLDGRRAAESIKGVVVPRLSSHMIGELSDTISQVFATDNTVMIVRESDFNQVWVRTNRANGASGLPQELHGLET